jgi:hypothetical protein
VDIPELYIKKLAALGVITDSDAKLLNEKDPNRN